MISEFKDQYAWLSNFYPLYNPIVVEGISYPTVEHYYVAMKTLNKRTRLRISKRPRKGLKAYGKTLVLRDDWEEIKLEVMAEGLRQKFYNNFLLKRKLIKTGDSHIQEGNYWNDKYWGKCLKTGHGKNHLGRLLMTLRSEISKI